MISRSAKHHGDRLQVDLCATPDCLRPACRFSRPPPVHLGTSLFTSQVSATSQEKKSTKEKEQEKQEEKDATNFRPPNPIDIQTPLCPLRLLHRGGGLGAKVAVDVQPGRVAAVQRRLERRDARAQGRVLEDAAAAAADGRVLGHEAVGAALDVLGRVAVAVRSGEKLGWECGCGEGESGPDEEAGGIHRGGVGLWTRFTGWRLSSEFGDFLIR